MDLKMQRNVLAGVVVLLLAVVAVLLGTGGLTGAAGGQGKGKGIPGGAKGLNTDSDGNVIVTDDNALQVDAANVGTSVVGTDLAVLGLTIANSGGNDIVYVSEGLYPAAYGGGSTNVANKCSIPGGGIADVGAGSYAYDTKKHQYEFTFTGGKKVSSFQIGVLDWGDFLPFGGNADNTYAMVMTGYDDAGNVVATSTKSFTTTDTGMNRRNTTEYGNLATSGDACNATEGQPGKFIISVSGPAISRITLSFRDRASMDPHVALWLGAMTFTEFSEDPFVTGGGWIESPDGACSASDLCAGATGTANYGFVAKYLQGQPQGSVEFNFSEGNFNFHSDYITGLVIDEARAWCQITGQGQINNQGSYSFMLSCIDGKLLGAQGGGGGDLFRMKIVDNATGAVVFDSQAGADDNADPNITPGDSSNNGQGGGAIVIHLRGN